MEDLRKLRKSKSLCVQCGCKLDRTGIYCSKCNDGNNKNKLRRVHRLHERGLCTTCEEPLDRDGWFCKSCTDKLKTRARIRSAERRLLGLCVQCGNEAEDGMSQCRRCLDALKERRNRNYVKKLILKKDGIQMLTNNDIKIKIKDILERNEIMVNKIKLKGITKTNEYINVHQATISIDDPTGVSLDELISHLNDLEISDNIYVINKLIEI